MHKCIRSAGSVAMSVIALIPARGQSKGIPKKNLQLLAGKPLIVHSILDAQEAQLVDEVYVSTDDPDIAEIACQYHAKVIARPTELSSDTASSEAALSHALSNIEASGISPEYIVFLQCTSPIRTGMDIDQAITQCQTEDADSLVSVSPSHRFFWEHVNGRAHAVNYDYRQRPRRQDMMPQYTENGSIYIFKPWVLTTLGNRLGGRISLFVMNETASWDIDTLLDLKVVEYIISQNQVA